MRELPRSSACKPILNAIVPPSSNLPVKVNSFLLKQNWRNKKKGNMKLVRNYLRAFLMNPVKNGTAVVNTTNLRLPAPPIFHSFPKGGCGQILDRVQT